ncbi:MAG: NAD(P)-dependent oxidoreductase [Alphaproteobacteria bacterium]|nr:NAD(P)-dependent oxidoreductase [Alphaproteobacteria bacterium]
MKPIIAVISPGNMGAGIGGRLAEQGAEVRTWLSGRSAASAERARRAGMNPSDERGIAAARFVLSIVPPGDALALAERLAPSLRAAPVKPVYVDCNAVNPGTAARIAEVVEATGCAFIDGGIIGGPPTPGGKGPALYVSGSDAARAAALISHGLDIRVLEGPIGAASALKMSYAGITKGFTALGTAMALAATRAGAAEALHRELAESQPALLGWLTRQVPRMYPKAYRWVAEMEEIAGFIGAPDAGAPMLDGAARLYQRIANDAAGEQDDTGALSAFYRDTK